MRSRRLLQRRARTAVVLFVLLSLFYLYCPPFVPPDWTNDLRNGRPAPERHEKAKGDFTYHSRFRTHIDHDFEAQLERALTQIERTAEPQGEVGIMKIWQTWRNLVPPKDREKDMLLWAEFNPGWEYTLVTDALANEFVDFVLHDIPSLSYTWRTYPSSILRADLLRYLLLWYHGGFYADIDVHPCMSVSACGSLAPFFPEADHLSSSHNVSLVVGIEIDEPYASAEMKEAWHWSRSYGFLQYTLFAPRRFSPILRRAIVRALAHSERHNKEKRRWWRGARYSEEDILETTGPGMFTDALLDVLSETLPPSHMLAQISSLVDRNASTEQSTHNLDGPQDARVTWAPFHRLQKPLWIDAHEAEGNADSMGGLVVLPLNVWANGQRHSGVGSFLSEEACVNHWFGRTWKKGWWEYLVG
ncbi:hypothetical protein B0A49_05000 [Cryomyces minteri]|uniref:Alpha 1,4-glycosyltransferase domain-containing protein n=1 Tax=Cryomyces minteri TaxID=331657 RepID=A0A4U0XD81_9PEZI|nr:hypothetical protein B0A49_05000 [Cryomyces minteri]